jgi:hypothetical protein
MIAQDSENVTQEQEILDAQPSDTNAPEDNNTNEADSAEDVQAKNIREMRLIKEKAEKERDEAYRKLEEMKTYKTKQEEPVEEDLNISIAADELVEGKHLSKVAKKIKKLEDELKATRQASTAVSVEAQLKNKYSDFDKVVSKENIEALTKDYPEMGNILRSSSDLYSQAVTAYTMIKKMGIYTEDKFADDRAKAEANAAKPRPLTSVSPQQGDSPLTRANAFANGLTPELKKQLIREMNEARERH